MSSEKTLAEACARHRGPERLDQRIVARYRKMPVTRISYAFMVAVGHQFYPTASERGRSELFYGPLQVILGGGFPPPKEGSDDWRAERNLRNRLDAELRVEQQRELDAKAVAWASGDTQLFEELRRFASDNGLDLTAAVHRAHGRLADRRDRFKEGLKRQGIKLLDYSDIGIDDTAAGITRREARNLGIIDDLDLPASQQLTVHALAEEPAGKRGRPRKPDAKTPAERQRDLRDRRKAKK